MSSLTYAFTVVMAINVMLFLGQHAVLQVNADAPRFHDCQGSILGGFSTGNCSTGTYILDDSNPTAHLPADVTKATGDNTGSTSLFSDAVSMFKNWLISIPGLGYLVQILSAPYNLLKALQLPAAFVFAVGGLWYGVTLLLIVLVIIGRDD